MPATTVPPLPPRLVRVDLARWRRSVAELVAARPARRWSVDLRGDAYGHGAADCAAALAALADEVGVGFVPRFDREPVPADAVEIGPESFGLVPGCGLPTVLTLDAELMLVKHVDAGEAVSYGRGYVLDAPTRTGTVAIGYSHGVSRRASGRASVQHRGERLPVAGAISMDMLVVDLGDRPAEPGDRVTVIGDGADGAPTVHDWAEWTGLPPAAVTTLLSSRIPRRTVDGDEAPAAPRPAPVAPGPEVRLDGAAFARNLASLRARFAPASLWLVAKAGAYGHGWDWTVPAALAGGVAGLAVLDIDSALELRGRGIDAPMFAWMHPVAADYAGAIAADVDLGVNSPGQLEAIGAAAEHAGGPARVHLKFDSGLHRGGIDERDWDGTVARAVELAAAGRVRLVGAWTHLSETSHDIDREALGRLDAAIARAERLGARFECTHAAATGTAIDLRESHRDAVRIGSGCYGVSPDSSRTAASLGVEPVLSLTAPVLEVGDERAELAIGYGDGLPAAFVGGATPTVRIAGREAAVVRVEVDRTCVALPAGAPVAVGDVAVVLGAGAAGCERWGDWAGTVGEEILAAIPPRVPRLPLPSSEG